MTPQPRPELLAAPRPAPLPAAAPAAALALTSILALAAPFGPCPAAAATVFKELPATPGGLLEVDLDAGGDIEVIGWDQALVRVEAATDAEEGPGVEIEPVARGVRIESREGGLGQHGGSVDLKVRVPRRYDLDLETMGGDLRLRGLEGRLKGETMGGELDLSDLKGELDLTTMGGEVELRGSAVTGEVRTMGGEVLFEDVTGAVKGSSMGGDVTYRNVRPAPGSGGSGAVAITTMGGDIRVDKAPDGADVQTMGGEIEVLAADHYVKARTMGGSVRIAAVNGWVEASTMGGDVEVTMIGDPASGRRDVELSSQGGEIYLAVPGGLAMSVDIEIRFGKHSSRAYKVMSDFPLAIAESADWESHDGEPWKRIRATGTIGAGTHRIKIRTMNGNVTLKKGN